MVDTSSTIVGTARTTADTPDTTVDTPTTGVGTPRITADTLDTTVDTPNTAVDTLNISRHPHNFNVCMSYMQEPRMQGSDEP